MRIWPPETKAEAPGRFASALRQLAFSGREWRHLVARATAILAITARITSLILLARTEPLKRWHI